MEDFKPVVSIVGYSKTGKTTFLEALIKELKERGIRVGTIKHTHHEFEIDKEKKDSFRHRKAGAKAVLLASSKKIAFVEELEGELSLKELVDRFMGDVDIVLVEGYKKEKVKKIEMFDGKEFICKEDKDLLCVISDEKPDCAVPVFKKREIKRVADFLLKSFLSK